MAKTNPAQKENFAFFYKPVDAYFCTGKDDICHIHSHY